MKNACFILALMLIAPIAAIADDVAVSAVPAQMSDEALASYISGRLNAGLKEQGYTVSRTCDNSGCSVVVQ